MIRCGILIALVAVLVGCSRENRDLRSRPTIVLVVLDTVRADRVGATRMPNLARWANTALTYSNARTPAPFTMPAMASAMTGLYPHAVGIGSHGRDERLAAAVPTLAERARAAGYETAAVVTNPWLVAADAGFSRGFDRFVTGRSRGGARARMRADEVADEALAILNTKRSRPLFLWLHFMDAHMPYGDVESLGAIGRDFAGGPAERSRLFFEAPYEPGEILATRDAYDAAVLRIDTALRPVLDALGANAVAIVFSDHGESLGEHGLHFAHDFTLYDELLRVPLIVKTPGGSRGRVDAPVSLLDVAPTLCAIARLDCSEELDGRPLPAAAAERSRGETPRVLFAASAPARKRYRCPWLTVAGLEGRWTAATVGVRKVIRVPSPNGPRYRAFDLGADPLELVDRFDANADASLVRHLEQWTAAATSFPRTSVGSPGLPDSLTRELEELGYLE